MSGRKAVLVTTVWALLLAGCGDSGVPTDDGPHVPVVPGLADPPPDGAAAVATITAADLSERVGIVAHDSMMGRPTPSPELEEVARYAAAEFARLGLVPAGGDGYLQWFSATPEDLAQTPNVIALMPGSDPILSDQYIVIGAHFDHLGNRNPIAGDSIYNGADDNGSGTAGVLELAEAFASLDTQPRRSILFILFGGEERGLLGSLYYTDHPYVPMSSTAAMINIDMIGRNWTNMVAGIYQPESDIFERADQVADAHPELDMDLLTDPWPEENLVYRSDQYHFLKYGVPVLFLTSGLHEDYHQPSDEADTLDYEKTARLVRLVFWIGWEFAEATVPPGFPQ
jgi:hypothetical protein